MPRRFDSARLRACMVASALLAVHGVTHAETATLANGSSCPPVAHLRSIGQSGWLPPWLICTVLAAGAFAIGMLTGHRRGSRRGNPQPAAGYPENPPADTQDQRSPTGDVGSSSGTRLHLLKVRAELQREREFTSHIVSAAPTLICAVGPDGVTRSINHAVTEVTGFTADELIGKNWWDIFYPGNEYRQVEKLYEDFKQGAVVNYDMVLTIKDGSRRTISWNSVNRLDENGNIIEIIGIGADITERKHAEQELREAHAFLDSIVENIPDMIFVKDARQLRFIRFNRAGEHLLGYARQELIGKNDFDLFPRNEAEFFTANDRNVLDTGKTKEIIQEPIHTRTRGKRILHTKKMPILNEHGEPTYLLGISRDITEELAAQDALRRQALVFDNMYDGVILTDIQGRITDWNRGAQRIFGYTRSEVLGQSPEMLNRPEEAAQLTAQIQSALREHGRWTDELRFVDKSGKERTCEAVVVPLIDSDGQHIATVSVNRDVTHRKLTEERIRQHKAELERVSRFSALGEMTGDLAHQLRQPLTAVRIYLGGCLRRIRQDPMVTSDLVQRMTDAVRQADRASEIIRHAQSLVRGVEPQPEWVDLPELIRGIAALDFQHHAEHTAQMRIQLEEDLPPVFVDRIQIEQVTMNLIGNALDAAALAEGHDHVITIRTVAEPNDWVRIQIIDTGCGMSDEQLDRLFEPFFTTKETGLGLGLSISKRIVESHGGHLEVRRNDNRGMTFSFTIPVRAERRRPYGQQSHGVRG